MLLQRHAGNGSEHRLPRRCPQKSVSLAYKEMVENGILKRTSIGLVGKRWVCSVSVFFKEAKEILSKLLLCDNGAAEA